VKDGACEADGCIEGWPLGLTLGSKLKLGDKEGRDVGCADNVGEEDVEGAPEGEMDGKEETDGFRLIEGVSDGDPEGNSVGVDDGAVEIEGDDVGVLVDRPSCVTRIGSAPVTFAKTLPLLLLPLSLTRSSTNAWRLAFDAIGSSMSSVTVVSSFPTVFNTIS